MKKIIANTALKFLMNFQGMSPAGGGVRGWSESFLALFAFWKKIIFVLFFLGSGFLISAQSLEMLEAEMYQNNPGLKVMDYLYQAELERGPQLGQLPEPELGLNVFPLPVETRLGPQRFRLGVTQMFPWKGTLETRKEIVLAQAAAKKEEGLALGLDLRFTLQSAYYQLYELEEKVKILKGNFQLLEALEQLALTQVESGQGNMADVLQLQLKKETLELELHRLKIRKRKPTALLNQLLNRDPKNPVQITDSLRLIDVNPGIARLESNGNHPILRQLTQEQEASYKKTALNALERKPSFGLGMDYIVVGKRGDANPEHNGKDIWSPRLAVRIPLYGERYKAKNREEEIRIKSLETKKEAFAAQFSAEIESALADLEDAYLAVELSNRQRKTTQNVIELLQTTYTTSGQQFEELLQLTMMLADYELMELKAIVQSNIAKAKIEKYTKVVGSK